MYVSYYVATESCFSGKPHFQANKTVQFAIKLHEAETRSLWSLAKLDSWRAVCVANDLHFLENFARCLPDNWLQMTLSYCLRLAKTNFLIGQKCTCLIYQMARAKQSMHKRVRKQRHWKKLTFFPWQSLEVVMMCHSFSKETKAPGWPPHFFYFSPNLESLPLSSSPSSNLKAASSPLAVCCTLAYYDMHCVAVLKTSHYQSFLLTWNEKNPFPLEMCRGC